MSINQVKSDTITHSKYALVRMVDSKNGQINEKSKIENTNPVEWR